MDFDNLMDHRLGGWDVVPGLAGGHIARVNIA